MAASLTWPARFIEFRAPAFAPFQIFAPVHLVYSNVPLFSCWCLRSAAVLATIFYEPSTRTHCSFQAAMQRLGGSVISLDQIQNTSVKKGGAFLPLRRRAAATHSQTGFIFCCLSTVSVRFLSFLSLSSPPLPPSLSLSPARPLGSGLVSLSLRLSPSLPLLLHLSVCVGLRSAFIHFAYRLGHPLRCLQNPFPILSGR